MARESMILAQSSVNRILSAVKEATQHIDVVLVGSWVVLASARAFAA